jgi:diguanylate cyclase (GGDEF)-like protein/PAS domain S-box-containing protein
MENRLTPAKIAVIYAVLASLWIFASDRLLALAVADPTWLMWLSMSKGILFILITTLLLKLLLQTHAVKSPPVQDSASDNKLKARHLIAIFAALALLVPLSSYFIAALYGAHLTQIAQDDLTAISDLKSRQIEAWLQERRSDAEELSDRTGLVEKSSLWLEHGDTAARDYVLARMKMLSRAQGYEPVLLATTGRVELPANPPTDLITDQIWHKLVNEALNTGKPQRSELYRDGHGRIRLDYMVPLHLSDSQTTLGFIVLRAPVEHFLFPLVQSWPTASPSAEIVLTRRDGNKVTILNELRHRRGAALSLQLPLDNPELPAAASVLHNQPQTMEGIDYRGVRVLAAMRPIPGTNWHLVTKIDRDEVMTLFREMLLWVDLIAMIAVAVVASAVLLLWRQQQRLHQMTLLTRTLEKDQQLKLFYELPFIGMAISAPSSHAWLSVNDHLCQMLGYTRAELLATTWADLTHPDDLPKNLVQFERMKAGEIDGYKLEKRFLCKNGTPIDVNLDVKCARDHDGRISHIMAMIEDITGRKQSEAALRQAATVFESSHDGAIVTDIKGNILVANRAYLKMTGYSETELLGLNPRLLHSGRHNRDFYLQMWASILEAGYWQGEIWNRRKNGELYPQQLTISAVKDAQEQTTNYVGICSDHSQLKLSESRLEHLAHYDPLTDLPNRLLLQSHLTHALMQAQRHQRQLGVLYIDLDRFKNINDSLGYPVGDELLITLSRRLTQRLRSENMLGRLSGDEFLLIIDHMDSAEEAVSVARTLLELLSQPFILSEGPEVFIGASIGISIFPNDGDSAAQLIQHADAAMHHAKEQGRSTYRFYIDSLTREASDHLELETRLRHAIAAGQLRVYYQPQVDIKTSRIIGAEALVRWQDPERGLIPPAQFIPLAEETGLIGAIGEYVLRETCLQGAKWIAAGLPFLTLAVNLSPHQFLRSNIAELVSRVLAETGFPANHLELELTESALMQQEESAVKMLHLLRAQNIRLAIDDFGTGYSSLSYLKRFPLDILKIDKSFVDDIPFHQDDMEIAATIIAMGHTLGFKVLAEGVETAEQLAFLEAKGCDMYQGYLTSPPVPAEEFAALLSSKQLNRF